MAGHALAAARESMAVQDHRDTVQLPGGVAFNKSEFTRVKRAGGFVAQHGRRLAVEGVGACQLAGHHSATTAGGVAQADRITHSAGAPPVGEPKVNGSAPRFWLFFALRASSGGRTICTVRLPSVPA